MIGSDHTAFNYAGIKLSHQKLKAGNPVLVSAKVMNTGDRAGGEAVQLYLEDNDSSCTRLPNWQLVDFLRVDLKPGESRELSFEIPARSMCAIMDDGRAVVEPGRFTVYLGGSQPDLLSARLMERKPLEASFFVTGDALEMEY